MREQDDFARTRFVQEAARTSARVLKTHGLQAEKRTDTSTDTSHTPVSADPENLAPPAEEASGAIAQVLPERRQITVTFVDLVDSTALSTKLDPEKIGGLMHGFQQLCTNIVVRYGGFVARFMGDGTLAYFDHGVISSAA